MENETFSTLFKQLTGHEPFPWQERLYERFLAEGEDNIPGSASIPTGLGKTNVVAVWLLALAKQMREGQVTLPRRLVYVVNRRTVVLN